MRATPRDVLPIAIDFPYEIPGLPVTAKDALHFHRFTLPWAAKPSAISSKAAAEGRP
jgi:hypothetical protein